MADVTNVALGVCTGTYGGEDIGHTKGGVELSYEPVWQDVVVDAYGESKVDKRLMGEHVTVKVPLTEYTIANLKLGMPAGTVVSSNGKARIDVGKGAGLKASTVAETLVMTPVDATGDEHTITVHKAVAGNQITLSHVNDDQRIIEVEFEGLIDESKGLGAMLFSIGDPTAVAA